MEIAQVIAALFAPLFFGMANFAPKRSLYVAPVLGLMGYLVYEIINGATGSIYVAVFFGSLVASLPAEAFARIVKTPATVIIFISVIPLVPGVMLYRTMLHFVSNDFANGAYEMISTLLYSGSMVIAITISAMVGKFVFTPLFAKAGASDKKG